ncbi:MAG: Uma2 family endonuclease, partial [Clostridia bacterium]|nr:Uma2 family endonuclease [Deltaproteobacteria bacterium]
PFDKGRGGPGGWWIIDEPELHLRKHVLVPDVAGWPKSVMPVPPRDHRFEIPPTWLCEVLSPSNAKHDRIRKLDAYGQVGVQFAWIIDPLQHTLEVFHHRDNAWVRIQAFSYDDGDVVVCAQPFDAIELSLSDLWIPEE